MEEVADHEEVKDLMGGPGDSDKFWVHVSGIPCSGADSENIQDFFSSVQLMGGYGGGDRSIDSGLRFPWATW